MDIDTVDTLPMDVDSLGPSERSAAANGEVVALDSPSPMPIKDWVHTSQDKKFIIAPKVLPW